MKIQKLALLMLLLAPAAGCSSTQSSDIHAALVAADEAITLAEQHPEAVQKALDAVEKIDTGSSKLAQAVNDVKGALSTQNMQAAHAAIAAGLAVSAPKPTQ